MLYWCWWVLWGLGGDPVSDNSQRLDLGECGSLRAELQKCKSCKNLTMARVNVAGVQSWKNVNLVKL